MNEGVQQLMTKMMSGLMKPEDMPPRCMSIMFDKLDAEARKELATTMLQRMADELESQQSC